MRYYSMSGRKALRSIRPNKRSDWQALTKITACVVFAVAFVVGLVYDKHRLQMQREQKWTTAVATIENARTHLVMQNNSQGGGAMFYEVQILVRYSAQGQVQERWTTVSQFPKLLPDAELQAYLLTKKQCSIRWKPSEPNQIVAEIN